MTRSLLVLVLLAGVCCSTVSAFALCPRAVSLAAVKRGRVGCSRRLLIPPASPSRVIGGGDGGRGRNSAVVTNFSPLNDAEQAFRDVLPLSLPCRCMSCHPCSSMPSLMRCSDGPQQPALAQSRSRRAPARLRLRPRRHTARRSNRPRSTITMLMRWRRSRIRILPRARSRPHRYRHRCRYRCQGRAFTAPASSHASKRPRQGSDDRTKA